MLTFVCVAAIIAPKHHSKATWSRVKSRLVRCEDGKMNPETEPMTAREVQMAAEIEQLKRLVADLMSAKQAGPSGAKETNPEGETDFEDMDDYLRQRGIPKDKKGETSPKAETGQESHDPKEERFEKLAQKMEKMMKGKEEAFDIDEILTNDGLPAKFRMPDLTKFDGTGDPRMHLRQYAITMSTTGLGKVQILKLFMLSLQGAALSWYHDQDRWVREDWTALAEGFTKQYGYNTHLEVTLRDLELTKQRFGEGFADYIGRWRSKAAKMRNRPDERDQVRMVVKGAHPSISGKLQYTVLKTFEDLLEVGLLIEETESENRRNFQKKTGFGSETGQRQGQIGGNLRSTEVRAIQNRRFSNFGKPMSKILEKLKAKGLLEPLPPKQGEVPAHVNRSFYCQFHQAFGHSTDKCTRLRHEIQDLIDAGKITDPEGRPSTTKNPLPNHPTTKSTFAIESGLTEEEVSRSFEGETEEGEEVTSQYRPLWDQDSDSDSMDEWIGIIGGWIIPVRPGEIVQGPEPNPLAQGGNNAPNPLPPAGNQENHNGWLEGEPIEGVPGENEPVEGEENHNGWLEEEDEPIEEVPAENQENHNGWLEAEPIEEVPGENEPMEGEEDQNEEYVPMPDDGTDLSGVEGDSESVGGNVVAIDIWDSSEGEETDIWTEEDEVVEETDEEESGKKTIVESEEETEREETGEGEKPAGKRVHGMTRSGRHYQEKGEEPEKKKGKEPAREEEEEDDVVLKQLKKTQAQVSVWDLLCSSEKHRRVMAETLASMKISTNTEAEELMKVLVGSEKGGITFTDEDLPMEGRDHNKPLFIKVEVKGKKTTAAMVDDGSAINVCPRSILPRLNIEQSDLKQSGMVVRAYDDTKRAVDGTFEAVVKAGPMESLVEFTVIDIPASFALLLERPWFHKLGGVPSNLHQMIKFPYENKITVIRAEHGKVVAALEPAPLRGFQIDMIDQWVDPKVSKIMRRMTYIPGMGLGKNHTGIAALPDFGGQMNKRGFGYEGSMEPEGSEEERLKKKVLFIKEGNGLPYNGKNEVWMLNGEIKLGFEIFNDVVNWAVAGEKLNQKEEEEVWVEELLKFGDPSSSNAIASDEEELLVEEPTVEDPTDEDELFISELFETNDVLDFYEMNSSLAYLCDVYPDGSVHFFNHLTNNIHAIQSYSFNLGTNKTKDVVSWIPKGGYSLDEHKI